MKAHILWLLCVIRGLTSSVKFRDAIDDLIEEIENGRIVIED